MQILEKAKPCYGTKSYFVPAVEYKWLITNCMHKLRHFFKQNTLLVGNAMCQKKILLVWVSSLSYRVA